eukprot:408520-Rhodomonas_salina.1
MAGQAVPRLVEAIRGGEEETASFSLLCVGNLFMLPEARSAFLRCRGSVDGCVSRWVPVLQFQHRH